MIPNKEHRKMYLTLFCYSPYKEDEVLSNIILHMPNIILFVIVKLH